MIVQVFFLAEIVCYFFIIKLCKYVQNKRKRRLLLKNSLFIFHLQKHLSKFVLKFFVSIFLSICFFFRMLLDEKLESRSQLQTFLHLHQPQLQSSNVPEIFWQTLHTKLRNETFDAGEVFQIALFEDPEDSSKPAVRKLVVSSEEGIDATDDQHIYLVDHAWTYEANRAKQYLEEMPQLLTRMCDLMGFQGQDDLNETNKDERVEFVLEVKNSYFIVAVLPSFGSIFQIIDTKITNCYLSVYCILLIILIHYNKFVKYGSVNSK